MAPRRQGCCGVRKAFLLHPIPHPGRGEDFFFLAIGGPGAARKSPENYVQNDNYFTLLAHFSQGTQADAKVLFINYLRETSWGFKKPVFARGFLGLGNAKSGALDRRRACPPMPRK